MPTTKELHDEVQDIIEDVKAITHSVFSTTEPVPDHVIEAIAQQRTVLVDVITRLATVATHLTYLARLDPEEFSPEAEEYPDFSDPDFSWWPDAERDFGTTYSMFSYEGARLVHRALIDILHDDAPRHVSDEVITTRVQDQVYEWIEQGADAHREVGDTAVRDAIYEEVEKRRKQARDNETPSPSVQPKTIYTTRLSTYPRGASPSPLVTWYDLREDAEYFCEAQNRQRTGVGLQTDYWLVDEWTINSTAS